MPLPAHTTPPRPEINALHRAHRRAHRFSGSLGRERFEWSHLPGSLPIPIPLAARFPDAWCPGWFTWQPVGFRAVTRTARRDQIVATATSTRTRNDVITSDRSTVTVRFATLAVQPSSAVVTQPVTFVGDSMQSPVAHADFASRPSSEWCTASHPSPCTVSVRSIVGPHTQPSSVVCSTVSATGTTCHVSTTTATSPATYFVILVGPRGCTLGWLGSGWS